MQHIPWQDAPERCYIIASHNAPVATMSPGETFTVDTLDVLGNRVTGPNTPPTRVLSLPYINPVTGPIYVEGAEKGDTLSVAIHEIKTARDCGVSATIPEFGGLCGTSLTHFCSGLKRSIHCVVWEAPDSRLGGHCRYTAGGFNLGNCGKTP